MLLRAARVRLPGRQSRCCEYHARPKTKRAEPKVLFADAPSKLASPDQQVAEAAPPDGERHLPPHTVVNTVGAAQAVAQILLDAPAGAMFACDTEVVNFDADMGPWKNGEVICFSVYGGRDFDFGDGPGIWIDTSENMLEMLEPFRPFFEDPARRKIWHNYSVSLVCVPSRLFA